MFTCYCRVIINLVWFFREKGIKRRHLKPKYELISRRQLSKFHKIDNAAPKRKRTTKTKAKTTEKQIDVTMTIRFALCICVLLHLSLVNGVLGQTSIIEIGQTSIQSNNPVIYNRTIEFPAATSSTYQSVLRFFTRSDRPIVNVNRTFPPNSVS